MGFLDHVTRLGITGAALGATIPAFGGRIRLPRGRTPELAPRRTDPPGRRSRRRMVARGADALAFHTDYVDSYGDERVGCDQMSYDDGDATPKGEIDPGSSPGPRKSRPDNIAGRSAA